VEAPEQVTRLTASRMAACVWVHGLGLRQVRNNVSHHETPQKCRGHHTLMSRALAIVAVRPPVAARSRERRGSRVRPARAPVASAAADDPPSVSPSSFETLRASSTPETASAEALLLSRLRSVSGRGAGASETAARAIADAVSALERSGAGLSNPALRPEIEGTWRLLYTSKSSFDLKNPLGKRLDGTKPGLEGFFSAIFGEDAAKVMDDASNVISASSSPIQRTVTSLEAFTIQQAIRLPDPMGDEEGSLKPNEKHGNRRDPRVDQVARFGDGNYLRLSAKASVPETAESNRIDFTFDLAYFELATGPFGLKLPGTRPARVPYPVPFALLGDEAKGWLDTTYLGEDVRVSKGNKGTTFVFVREREEQEGGTPLPYEF